MIGNLLWIGVLMGVWFTLVDAVERLLNRIEWWPRYYPNKIRGALALGRRQYGSKTKP